VIKPTRRAHASRSGGEVITPTTVRLEVTGAPGNLIGSLASSPLPAFDLLGLSLHTGTGSLDLGSAIVSARSTHLVGADFAGTIRWHDEVIRIEVARPDL
jgi:hypothetical protein